MLELNKELSSQMTPSNSMQLAIHAITVIAKTTSSFKFQTKVSAKAPIKFEKPSSLHRHCYVRVTVFQNSNSCLSCHSKQAKKARYDNE